MDLNKYKKKEKEFIRALKRLNKIEEELEDLPLIPLQEPFQQGWEVFIRLREDIARRADGEFLQSLIDIGYKKSYRTKSLKDIKAIRRGEKFVKYIDWRGRHATRSLIPDKLVFSEAKYNEFSERQKKYFYLDFDYKNPSRKDYKIDLKEYQLQLKAKPYIVTHYREKGGELEREAEYLRSFLEEYWRTCENAYFDYRNKSSAQRARLRAAKQKFLKGEVEEIVT